MSASTDPRNGASAEGEDHAPTHTAASPRALDATAPRPDTAPVAAEKSAQVGRLAATVERLREEVQAARNAADGRALIELAKGILVERLHCGPAQAARQLAELADQSGISELELATDIINQAARDHVTRIATDFVQATGGGPPGDSTTPSVAVSLRTTESAALAADDTQTVAESLLHHALAPLGVTAVAVWTAGHDGSLTLSGHAGFPDEEAERWHYVPPGVATAARQALTQRRTVRLSTTADGPPTIGYGHGPHGGRIAVCAGTGGRIHGVLEICWPQPLADHPPAVERQLEALAELCAHTLEALPAPPPGLTPSVRSSSARSSSARSSSVRSSPSDSELVDLSDGLHDAALVLRPHLDSEGRLADFRIVYANTHFQDPAGRPRSALNGSLLLETYPLAVGGSEIYSRIERVYATGESFRAQRMTLTTLVDQVPLETVADISISRHGHSLLMIWRIEDETARLASLLQHAQRLGRVGGFEENLVTGEITWNSQLFSLYGRDPLDGPASLRDLATRAHTDDATAIGRFLRTVLHHQRPATLAFRLRRSDGVTRHIRIAAEPVLDSEGRLLLVRGAYQDISAQHWTEVALAATRDQLAHTEQESAERSRLALQLQHAIMPPTHGPLEAPGLHIAVRYRPAETEALVGGDWYDAVALPSGQILLCVGDIAGHGVKAATGMVVLRNALRGLAMTGAGPAKLLGWLNNVAHHLTDRVTATAVCALYDPTTRTLRWARAGHLPPVVVRSDNATTLPLTRGLLLGALADVSYDEDDCQLRPGDILLMYTDGLIERRDTAVQESMTQLLIGAQKPADTLGQRLDHLLTYSKSDTDDDTCLIGIQVEDIGGAGTQRSSAVPSPAHAPAHE
ncbi:SpoIIE family protein phosphatase [Streptomyces sp. p1417]|uniref:SpoIIE family protein phosphatase n=1 Tax=Streptomyces typhae TaxID=2681492 RepID=A0A6L6X5Y1_9ACTN|nr:SpoIIE family protein phosphatase [Streptomyces typhae]MVO89166.1 SpoIIE family protein phosphatase [Streptomyces typhae]